MHKGVSMVDTPFSRADQGLSVQLGCRILIRCAASATALDLR